MSKIVLSGFALGRGTRTNAEREKHPTDKQHKAKALSRWENEGGAKAKETERRGPKRMSARGKCKRKPKQIAKQLVSIVREALMNDNPTAIEPAFQLANSGRYASVIHILRALKAEGYSKDQVAGPSLHKQSKGLFAAHKDHTKPESTQKCEKRFHNTGSQFTSK